MYGWDVGFRAREGNLMLDETRNSGDNVFKYLVHIRQDFRVDCCF